MARKTSISGTHVILASTTSPKDTGLLDELISAYYRWTKLETRIDVVAVGTGAAMEVAKLGDADMLLTHDTESENVFLEEGYGVDRYEVMYNDFIIVGPKEDPARVMNADSALDAFRLIFLNTAAFVSRGDESGTHLREKRLWREIGEDPRKMKKYVATGGGMEAALREADALSAYTLCDTGTFLKFKYELLNTMQLFSGDPDLYNQYSIMAVNPARYPSVHYDEALDFIRFITGEEGQQVIGDFRDKYGNVLFTPNTGRRGEARKIA